MSTATLLRRTRDPLETVFTAVGAVIEEMDIGHSKTTTSDSVINFEFDSGFTGGDVFVSRVSQRVMAKEIVMVLGDRTPKGFEIHHEMTAWFLERDRKPPRFLFWVVGGGWQTLAGFNNEDDAAIARLKWG